MLYKSSTTTKLEFKETDGMFGVEGYASTFGNLDNVNDIIMQGAFKESIAERTPKFMLQHDSDILLGVINSAEEDSNGLKIKATFANIQCAMDARELVKMGALDSFSIGYSVVDSEYDQKGFRLLKKLTLWEVSLVTFPANEMAKVTGVKNSMTERDFEKFLRDEGKYSHDEAKTIASTGYKALMKQRDVAGEQLETLSEQFRKFGELFTNK